jgi:glycine betaine/proline transport system substrate-binding protein
MGEVLKKAGYNVEYVQADYLAQFAGLETGDLHVAMEMWETTGREAMDAAVATGKVENLRPTGMQAKEEWWYPTYMKESAPACRTGRR